MSERAAMSSLSRSVEKFAAVLAISTNVTVFLMLIGFVDGRNDMYVDIALSFAVLGFVSSVIVAKFMSGGGNQDDDRH